MFSSAQWGIDDASSESKSTTASSPDPLPPGFDSDALYIGHSERGISSSCSAASTEYTPGPYSTLYQYSRTEYALRMVGSIQYQAAKSEVKGKRRTCGLWAKRIARQTRALRYSTTSRTVVGSLQSILQRSISRFLDTSTRRGLGLTLTKTRDRMQTPSMSRVRAPHPPLTR